jgi:hypothetical protein
MMEADDEQLPSRILFPADSEDDVDLNCMADHDDEIGHRHPNHDFLGKPPLASKVWYGGKDVGPVRVLHTEHDNGSSRSSNTVIINSSRDGVLLPTAPYPKRRRTSPLTVTAHPTIAMDPIHFFPLLSTITMSEDGAEVILGLSTLSLDTYTGPQERNGTTIPTYPNCHTPSTVAPSRTDGGSEFRGSSLVDVDTTPSPQPPKKRDGGLHQLCCGTTTTTTEEEEWQDDTTTELVVFASHLQVEQTISAMLEYHGGGNGAGCSAWQGWSYFGLLGLVEETSTTEGALNEDIRKVLRNRAFDMSGRKKKIRHLRYNLNPFAAPTTPERPSQSELYRSRSFSIQEHAPGIVRVSQEKNASSSSLSNGFADILSSCTLPNQALVASPVFPRTFRQEGDGDVCYDSDPEDFTRRRSPPHRPLQSGGDDKENRENYHKYSYPRYISSAPTGRQADTQNAAAFGAVIQVSHSFSLGACMK